MAREVLLDARKAVLKGVSPALEKQREKRRMVAIKTFGTAMDTWLANARLTACAALRRAGTGAGQFRPSNRSPKMSHESNSLAASLMVRDARGRRYRPATDEQILEAARQVVDRMTQRGLAFKSSADVKTYLQIKLPGLEHEVSQCCSSIRASADRVRRAVPRHDPCGGSAPSRSRQDGAAAQCGRGDRQSQPPLMLIQWTTTYGVQAV